VISQGSSKPVCRSETRTSDGSFGFDPCRANLADDEVKGAIDVWKATLEGSDYSYQRGVVPRDRDLLMMHYEHASTGLADQLKVGS
jgi:hypothetical protein